MHFRTDSATSDAELSALFQDAILDHYRKPRNKGALPDADATGSVSNPLCGDQVTIYLSLDGERIRAANFAGQGCSISQASASMLTSAVIGMTSQQAADLGAKVDRMLGAVGAPPDDTLGELVALSAVAAFPARLGCALMAWQALAEALRNR